MTYFVFHERFNSRELDFHFKWFDSINRKTVQIKLVTSLTPGHNAFVKKGNKVILPVPSASAIAM